MLYSLAMPHARQRLGQRGETLAAAHLQAQGYTLITRNYRCPNGEIDIVAQQGETWVFVEVRARRGEAFGPPEASLTPRKRAHLLTAAQHYLHTHQLMDVAWRIDMVAIVLTAQGHVQRLTLIENAISQL